MINQLFKRRPDEDELIKILNCYNLENLHDDKIFSFIDLNYYDTINKLYSILDILIDIYMPCKYYYINNLNNKKCITILRQICKLFNKKLYLDYIVDNKTKILSFSINNNFNQSIKIKKNVVVKFN